MKKLMLLFIGVIAMPNLFAQDISDAVRYSTDNILGTARFRAMSGAFGALGGDMSAVSLNPAGSAIFSRSHASLSVANYGIENDASYFGNINASSNSNFEMNQAGAAFVFNNTNSNSPWRKFVLSLAYDQTQNFDNDFFASGVNTTSIDSYFLANAQGTELYVFTPTNSELSQYFGVSESTIANNDLLYYDLGYQFLGEIEGYQQQQNFLGYYSYILEPDNNTSDNTSYTSNIAPGTFSQEYSYAATGYNGKFGVNAAMQYEDNLYLGVNLNSHFINYTKSTFLYESNSNAGSLINEVGFENNLNSTGTGFSFQLGAIAKLTDIIRVGVTYDSPIWYTISEETTQYIATVRNDNGSSISQAIDPLVVNIFPDYKLQTPAKITGSVALILSKQGLISFDYSRKDYGNTKFKPESDSHFIVQNNIISNNLKAANTYRLGGELRHKEFSFRGGYRFEESPYENTDFYGDLTGYSLGIGYNFGNARLDFAYENSERTIGHQLYNVGLTDAASIDTKNSDFTLSLSFSL